MGRELVAEVPRVFIPLEQPGRYKGAHGGRGSAKSHYFAGKLVRRCVERNGTRWICGRQVQRSLKESAYQLVSDKIEQLKAPGFRVLNDRIVTPGKGVIIFEGMADHTVDSIKSLEDFDGAWVEEANKLTANSLKLLRPTIRAPGSELWFSWNPQRKTDPVDALLRGEAASELGAIVIKANWKDNPWFPEELEKERLFDLKHDPDGYPHTWDGGYATARKGAYFSAVLQQAKTEGRIGHVARDPNMQVRTFWDLGRRDFTSIWVAQWIGKSINVIDYIEGAGQPPSYYFQELREKGYRGCMVYLPHDGSRVGPDNATGLSYEEQATQAGFDTQVIMNQGEGAAMLRINAVRRIFPQIWVNESTTEAGREALAAYHEKKHEALEVGLGPLHDWSSHAADAFGLMCIAYEEPKLKREGTPERRVYTVGADEAGTAWMGQ